MGRNHRARCGRARGARVLRPPGRKRVGVASIPRCGRVGDQGKIAPTSRTDAQIRHPARRHLCARASCAASLTGLLAIVLATALVPAVAADASAQTPFVPYFGKNQIRYDNFRVAHLHDRSLRDLLLPRDRAAPRAGRRLRRERVSARQLRPEARPRVQGAAHPLQDEQRVPAAERHPGRRAGRRRRVRRADAQPHGACRSTSRPTCSTG